MLTQVGLTVGIVVVGALASLLANWLTRPKGLRTGIVVAIVVITLGGLATLTVLNTSASTAAESTGKAATATGGPPSILSGPPQTKIDNSAGWGPDRPTFSDKSPAPYVVFDSITDSGTVGDERNFLACKDSARSSDGWQNQLIAEDGHVYRCRVVANNDVADNLDDDGNNPAAWMHDARLTVKLPDKSIYNPGVTGFLGADNAQTVWASCNFVSPRPMRLIYSKGSARMYTNGTPQDGLPLKETFQGDTMTEGLLVSPGAQLGYDKQDGVVRHSYQYSVYVTFEFRIELDPGA